MKQSIVLIIVLLFALTFSADAKYRGYDIEFNYFYQTLAPHGEWIELDYDNYVWRPNRVGRNWSPYSEGRWVWSSDGWYWDSYEPFGWATYHYGRWHYDRFYGWVWTPGNEWAPAWVEWRHDDNYIGWAPLPPYAYFNTNFGIQFSIEWNSPYSHWRFVRYNRFTHKHVDNYYVKKYHVKRFFGRTKHITNYQYEGRRIVNRGIKRSIIERRGRTKIHETRMDNIKDIRNRNMQSNDRNSVRVYRPSEVEVAHSRNSDRYSFRKTSNSFLLREKTEKNRESVKKRRDIEKKEKRVYNKNKSSNRVSNLSKQKSVKRKENINKSSNERSNKVTRQKVNGDRNTVQLNERSQTKNKNSSSRKVTKGNNKSRGEIKSSRVKKDSNNNSTKKKTEKKRVEKQVRSRSKS